MDCDFARYLRQEAEKLAEQVVKYWAKMMTARSEDERIAAHLHSLALVEAHREITETLEELTV